MPDYYEILSRQEYDLLVENYPEWMENNWNKLERSWLLNVVTISGDPDIMDDLYTLWRDLRNAGKLA